MRASKKHLFLTWSYDHSGSYTLMSAGLVEVPIHA